MPRPIDASRGEALALRKELEAERQKYEKRRYVANHHAGFGVYEITPLTAIDGVRLLIDHLGLQVVDIPATGAGMKLEPWPTMEAQTKRKR